MRKYNFSDCDLRQDNFSIIEINPDKFLLEPVSVGILITYPDANPKRWIELSKEELCLVFKNMATHSSIEKFGFNFNPKVISLEALQFMTIRRVEMEA